MKNIKYLAFIFTLVLLCTQMSFALNSGNNLTEKVRSAIETRYGQTDINVDVPYKGQVVLEGSVNSLYDKDRIFTIVSRVSGVMEITNDLVVKTKMLPDAIIKQNVKLEIARMGAIVEPDKIKVAVDNGLVELSGSVSYYREKILAETAASMQKGVKSIANEIKVKPIQKALTDKNLEKVLQSVRKDEFGLSNDVHINVKNGIATITGTVSDLWTKRNMQKEFSDIIGVLGVVNKLKVKPEIE